MQRRELVGKDPSPGGPATVATGQNGPTEAMNNLAKRIKRVGFGFRSFANYRIRTLLYAGKPDWSLLPTLSIPG